MDIAITVLIIFIALLHLYIMWFEMFAWESRGPIIFRGFPKELFPKTKSMAANQGLYNGFLAAGLLWSTFIQDADWSQHIAIFFLICVGIAGIYGAMTVSRKIMLVQTVPALITLALIVFKTA